MQPLTAAPAGTPIQVEYSLSGGSLYYKGPALQKTIPGFFESFIIFDSQLLNSVLKLARCILATVMMLRN